MNLYLLPILKLLGLLATTFFGVAEHLNQRAKSPQSESRRRRWGIAAILISFSIAAGAELIDTLTRKQEAISASKRAADAAEKTERIIGDLNRSLHPLLPFTVTAEFALNTQDSAFRLLRSKLIKVIPREEGWEWPALVPGGNLFPDRQKDPMAYALLTAYPQTTVFLTKGPIDTSLAPEKQLTNLSFQIGKTFGRTEFSPGIKNHHVPDPDGRDREFHYGDSGGVVIYFPSMKVGLADCYSDGAMVSVDDLLGAQIRVDLSPYFVVKRAEGIVNNRVIIDAIELYELDIELPGHQVIELYRKDFKQIRGEGMGHGFNYLFIFPKTLKEMSRIFEP